MMDVIGELVKSNPAKLELFEAVKVLECEKELNTELANRLHCYPGNKGKKTRAEIINMAINTVLEQLDDYHKLNVEDIQDYIDERIKHYGSLKLPNYNSTAYAYFRAKLNEELWSIKQRLDALDERPKAHYIVIDQRIDETEPLEYKCSKCKNTFYFDEVYDYCIKCGSKMENAREILGG